VHGANRLASNSLLDGLVFGARVVDAIGAGKTEAEPTGAMAGVLEVAPPARVVDDPVVLPKEKPADPAALRSAIQRVMTHDCGVERDASGLRLAAETLDDLASLAGDLPPRQIATYEAMNLARVARAIVTNATAREESRGAHTRVDFPDSSDDVLGRFVVSADDPPLFVPLPEPALRRAAR
jgi:L-aspartate oxidase